MRNAEFEALTQTHLASEPVLGFVCAALDSELEERGRTRRVDEAPTLRRAEALAANPTPARLFLQTHLSVSKSSTNLDRGSRCMKPSTPGTLHVMISHRVTPNEKTSALSSYASPQSISGAINWRGGK